VFKTCRKQNQIKHIFNILQQVLRSTAETSKTQKKSENGQTRTPNLS